MREFHPLLASQRLAEVQARYERSSATLVRSGAGGAVDPFRGQLYPGKSGLDEIRELHPEEPLRQALIEWHDFLTNARVNLPAHLEELRFYREEKIRVAELGDREFSLVELSRAVQTGDERHARAHFEARRKFSRRLGAQRVLVLERENEIAVRLGFSGVTEVYSPCVERSLPLELARKFLKETREGEWSQNDAFLFRRALLARDASEGWPARLQVDTLRELIGFPRLFDGLTLSGLVLPERRVPTSFSLALARVGFAWAFALRPQQFPFVFRGTPGALRERTRGHFFASLVLLPRFIARRLDLSGAVRQTALRAMHIAQLLELRLAAARVVSLAAAREGTSRLREASSEMSLQLVADEWQLEEWLGVFGAPGDAEFDFMARLMALSELGEFVERYDEDFFESERAAEKLRDEQCALGDRYLGTNEANAALTRALARLVGGLHG